MRRRIARHLALEFNDVDYWSTLPPKEKEWMRQFLFEYYQGDFNFKNPIHDKSLRKDCHNRKNQTKRQIHSVGSDILDKSIRKVEEILSSDTPENIRIKPKYYSIFDYLKVQDTEDENENDD